jgi:hypothetical protein
MLFSQMSPSCLSQALYLITTPSARQRPMSANPYLLYGKLASQMIDSFVLLCGVQ